jgi:hypothetical protein
MKGFTLQKFNTYWKISFGFTSLIILFLLWGCAPERKFQDHHFYSSHPKMAVDLSPDFQQIESGTFSGKFNVGTFVIDYYFFTPASDKKVISKGVIIIINKYDFLGDNVLPMTMLDEKWTGLCEHSLKNFNDETYETAVINQPLGGINDIEKTIQQKGYVLPSCKLYRIFMQPGNKCDGGYNPSPYPGQAATYGCWIKEILYFEDNTTSVFKCEQWKNLKTLSPDQIKYVHKFIDRADMSIQFLPQ